VGEASAAERDFRAARLAKVQGRFATTLFVIFFIFIFIAGPPFLICCEER
jgi:hypothetical protein